MGDETKRITRDVAAELLENRKDKPVVCKVNGFLGRDCDQHNAWNMRTDVDCAVEDPASTGYQAPERGRWSNE